VTDGLLQIRSTAYRGGDRRAEWRRQDHLFSLSEAAGLRFVNADVLAAELALPPYEAARVADALFLFSSAWTPSISLWRIEPPQWCCKIDPWMCAAPITCSGPLSSARSYYDFLSNGSSGCRPI
jgi:hypothetical protein